MATAHDVAAYILHSRGEVTAMKLHILAYYGLAWSLVWDERPLFDDSIEARPHGPVVASLYPLHASRFRVADWPLGHAESLTPAERETLDAILDFYGPKSTHWLGQLVRAEEHALARPACTVRSALCGVPCPALGTQSATPGFPTH